MIEAAGTALGVESPADALAGTAAASAQEDAAAESTQADTAAGPAQTGAPAGLAQAGAETGPEPGLERVFLQATGGDAAALELLGLWAGDYTPGWIHSPCFLGSLD